MRAITRQLRIRPGRIARAWALVFICLCSCRDDSDPADTATSGGGVTAQVSLEGIDRSKCHTFMEFDSEIDLDVPAEQAAREHLATQANHRGIAYLTAGQSKLALQEFLKVQQLLPHRVEGAINEATVYVHIGSPCSDVGKAIFERVIEADPDQPYALYHLTLLAEESAEDDALEQMLNYAERFVAQVPDDVFGRYRLGLALDYLDREEDALEQFQRCLELDPHFIPAHQSYASLLSRLRADDPEARERAASHRQRVQELNTMGKSVRFSAMGYTERGPFAQAMPLFGLGDTAQISESEEPIRFEDVTAGAGTAVPSEGQGISDMAGLIVLDANGDGRQDLFLPGGMAATQLWLNASPEPESAAEPSGAIRLEDASAAWGVDALDGARTGVAADWDRDGDPDLIVSGRKRGELLVNQGNTFAIVSNAGEADLPAALGQPSLEDIDHDGDEDLFWPGLLFGGGSAEAQAPTNLILRNVVPRDAPTEPIPGGSLKAFEPAPDDWGIGRDQGGIMGILWSDVDRDLDADGIAFGTFEGGLRVYENKRESGFTWNPDAVDWEPGGFQLGNAALGDLDNNGRLDVILAGRGERAIRVLFNREGRLIEDPDALEQWPDAQGELLVTGIAPVDVDNDGDLDLVALYPSRGEGMFFCVLVNDGLGRLTLQRDPAWSVPGPAWVLAPVDLDNDGRMDLAIRTAEGLRIWKNTTANGFRGVHVDLARSAPTEHHWKFSCPTGAKVLLRAGRYAQLRRSATASGFLVQAGTRLHFGLGDTGDTPEGCSLEILWPSGTIQGVPECPFATKHVATIREVDVRVASCPFLFVWDGKRYRFMGDILAASPPGLYVAPNVYATCDPDEHIRIPSTLLGKRDGYYDFVVHECLREVAYLDQAQLVAVDHDEDVRIFPNERFSGPPPFPEDKLFAVRRMLAPVAARDLEGRDRLKELEAPDDGKTINGFTHLSLPGFAERHAVELQFEEVPEDERLVLLLHGYLKFPGSPVQYVAAEQGLRFEMPRLERLRDDGSWELLSENIGAPAGFPRTMTVELDPGVLSGDGTLRISTNICVYWDWARMGVVARDAPFHVTRLAPERAELAYTGFPRYRAPEVLGQPEQYDYGDRALIDQPLDPGLTYRWPKMTGRYTRFGDVRALMGEADDRYVIFGAGEQVRLLYDASELPALKKGMSRTVLLRVAGWVKDNYHQTATSATVEPLPYHAMPDYPDAAQGSFPWSEAHREWDATYNTRIVSDSAAF